MPEGTSIIQYSEDLNNAEAPEPMAPNIYPAEIVGAEQRTSQTTGNRYLSVQFRISPDAYPADYLDGDADGMVLTYNRVVIDDNRSARWRMKKFLEAVGGPLSRNVDPMDLIGLTANVDVGIDEYEGEKRNAIKRVMAA